MNKIRNFRLLGLILIVAYLVSACGGALPLDDSAHPEDILSTVVASSSRTPEVEFEHTAVSTSTSDTPEVEVEHTAVSIFSSSTLEPIDTPGVDDNGVGNTEFELTGLVQAITANTITINGVVYNLADFTEFKDLVSVGDQVKVHVLVNANGTFVLREVEISLGNDNNSTVHDANDDHGSNSGSDDDHSGSEDDHSGGDDDHKSGSDDNSGHDDNDNSGEGSVHD